MHYTRGTITVLSVAGITIFLGLLVGLFVFDSKSTTYNKKSADEPKFPRSEVINSPNIPASRTIEVTRRLSESTTNTATSSTSASKVPKIPTESQITTASYQGVEHIATPEHVRALYMSSWIAGSKFRRQRILHLIENSNLNAIVIDIKDSSGRLAFPMNNRYVQQYETTQIRIQDITELLDTLHDKNIYVIGRISVFQDPYLASKYPELALKTKEGEVWRDKKGLAFLDMQNKTVWKYTLAIAKEAYALGFDEINFDYIRFPSDGKVSDIEYGLKKNTTRPDVIEDFFAYLDDNLPDNIVTSADLFGMVTTNEDDLGIGQILERALPYFDYIAPMIYPSHYPSGWNNFTFPAERPYDVIYRTMKEGIVKVKNAGYSKDMFRPWIQDFHLGVRYTPEMVQKQIDALTDLGIHSWMVWDPANTYTGSVFRDLEDL